MRLKIIKAVGVGLVAGTIALVFFGQSWIAVGFAGLFGMILGNLVDRGDL